MDDYHDKNSSNMDETMQSRSKNDTFVRSPSIGDDSTHISREFLSTHRSQSNFLKNNDNPTIEYPSIYSSEYEPISRNMSVLMKYLNAPDRDYLSLICTAAGAAFWASFSASLLTMYFRYEDYMIDSCPDIDFVEIKSWFLANSKAMTDSLQTIKFLPLFLLVSYTLFIVDRWRTFLITCHTIQGRIQNIGLLCGSAPSVPVTTSSKKLLYTIYRYLNVIHCLCLKNLSTSLQPLQIETDYVTKLKLLTRDEALFVASMENKARDGMFTLLANAIDALLAESNKNDLAAKSTILHQEMCRLRSECSKLQDLFVRDNPNEYSIFMYVLIYIYTFLIVIFYPLQAISSSYEENLRCIQPGPWIATFFLVLAFNLPFHLQSALRNPFDKNGERIDVDSLIASTDLCLFQVMRALWHVDTEGKVCGQNNNIPKGGEDPRSLLRRQLTSKMLKGSYGDL